MAPLLTGKLFRPELYHFEPTLDSTNCYADQLARAGAEQGTVVVADHQSHGRGRQGRRWLSPAGLNLYFSIVLRPAIATQKAAQLTLIAGLALARSVAQAGATEVEIKWPNDLLLQGRKLAGILTEMRTSSPTVPYVIVGIGVNIHGNSALFPVDLRDHVETLAGFLRCPVNRSHFLAATLAEISVCYERFQQQGFVALRQDWLRYARVCGQRVRVERAGTAPPLGLEKNWIKPPENFDGQAESLDEDGFLLVKQQNGMISRILSGDVKMLGGD